MFTSWEATKIGGKQALQGKINISPMTVEAFSDKHKHGECMLNRDRAIVSLAVSAMGQVQPYNIVWTTQLDTAISVLIMNPLT